MSIRESIEQRERETLSDFATLSSRSKGRTNPEKKQDEIRTCFQVDRDRIIYSKAFKRLKGKTQVFIMPQNDHFENRLSHTLKASQIARTIATALNLNEALAEAIMLAHDTGHSPFGHAGEEALNKLFHRGFDHQNCVIRRLEHLEKKGTRRGLNLSYEVLDGILHHSGFNNYPKAITKEGTIAPFADKIAYLTSDVQNAVKAGIVKDIPDKFKNCLGENESQMIDKMVLNIIRNSKTTTKIRMSDEMFEIVSSFREFMYQEVYFSKPLRKKANKVFKIIEDLYFHLKKYPENIPDDYDDSYLEQNIVDYISSMTDRYCLDLYQQFFFV
ncbi:MAG: HD domain-containing protein [Candidatus Pacebacteria bacterium]|nr:HD domain-containing protein [Candidatus Paceibacterota bacterium]